MITLARRPTVSSRGRTSTAPAPSTVRWKTLPGAPTHHDGAASAGLSPFDSARGEPELVEGSKSNDHGSGGTTRTRACPVTPLTVAFTNPPWASFPAVSVPSGLM